MCYYQNKGYILLMVIIFLQIFSSLAMYELTSVMMTFKINQHRWLREVLLFKSKQTLREIEHRLLENPLTCFIPIHYTQEIIQKPIEWWQLQGCVKQMAHLTSYYVIEPLGNDPCAFILKKSTNLIITAYYYRITLLTVSSKNRNSKLILQSTIAKASPDHLSCLSRSRFVLQGRQMMREL